jgi:hypothetical protein
MRKKLHSLPALLLLTLASAGCTSRTTPLPPPEVSKVGQPSGEGDVSVIGFALDGASVAVVNERTLEGTITTPDSKSCTSVCEFTAVVRAESGDALRVWQFFETESAIDARVP